MYIQQLYTSCLSAAAYYIESNGEAAIIDPLRDIDDYLQLANQRNASIKYIIETHFHADFVSGHLDLQTATGATIIFGPQTTTQYPVHIAKDGEAFALGHLTLVAVHTPGHTIESTCWLLKDAQQKDYALFTGDTLFVGDAGRPDLSSGMLTPVQLAALLYHSLHVKLAPLANEVLIYPAHGAGSACGKNLGPETYSTLGEQRLQNHALQPQSAETFIEKMTNGLTAPPAYFSINAAINQQGAQALAPIQSAGLTPLSAAKFKALTNKDEVVIIDTRPSDLFSQGFVPGSIFVGLEGRMAEWAASLISTSSSILLVTEAGKETESVTRLARVGFGNMLGYLKGGYQAWSKAGYRGDLLIDVEADELAMDLPFDDNLLVMDVRTTIEFGNGHVVGAMLLPLAEMSDMAYLANLPETANIYIHCASGYRSVVAASLLKQQGLHNVRNVLGGWDAIVQEKKIPVEKEQEILN